MNLVRCSVKGCPCTYPVGSYCPFHRPEDEADEERRDFSRSSEVRAPR